MSSESLLHRCEVTKLENKVKKFRILELKDLLDFANMDSSGSKKELLKKALLLVNNYDYCEVKNFEELSRKIDELLKQNTIPLRNLGNKSVDLGKYLFFTSIESLIAPHSFNVEKGPLCMELSIPQSSIKKIKKSQRMDGSYELEVQIKFWETLDVDVWDDAYIWILINNKPIYVPQPCPHIFYITKYCNFDANTINTVVIHSSKPGNMLGYYFDVSIVRRLTPLDFVSIFPTKIGGDKSVRDLVSNCIHNKSIKHSYKLLLICHKTKKTISFPCRSNSCTHPDVFDLFPFLEEMQYFLKWKCPVCSKPISYDSIYIDQTLKNYADSGKLLLTFFKQRDKRFYDQESEEVVITEETIIID
ncbi:E3 SUMO-protein ligase PIAS4-like [Parasteatoda tepidariorum]|uniref:E3 SUMO-protein ligase PIAS4-like n=1 Tax=Parasteatoda tepidariorum TaxID=114398 RepID=UPI00077FCD6A|nr:E3 SUMO-protein ligase PIAS4-like [Parasteatoda tepidariorum]